MGHRDRGCPECGGIERCSGLCDEGAATKDFQDTIAAYSPQGWAFMGAHADIAADDTAYGVPIVGLGVHYDHHLVASFR